MLALAFVLLLVGYFVAVKGWLLWAKGKDAPSTPLLPTNLFGTWGSVGTQAAPAPKPQ